MAGYNFEEDENELGQTRRIDSIIEETKKYLNDDDTLGGKEDYLKSFESERFFGPPQLKAQQRDTLVPYKKKSDDTKPVGGLGWAMGGDTASIAKPKYVRGGDTRPILSLEDAHIKEAQMDQGKQATSQAVPPQAVPSQAVPSKAVPDVSKELHSNPSYQKAEKAISSMLPKPLPKSEPLVKSKKKGIKQYQIILTLAIAVGALVLLGTGAVVFFSQEDAVASNIPGTVAQAVAPFEAVVLNISVDNGLRVQNIKTGEEFSFALSKDTRYQNQDGKSVSYNDILIGDVVKVEMNVEDGSVQTVSVPELAWKLTGATDVLMDFNRNELTVKSKTYKIESQTLYFYKDKPIAPQKLAPVDSLTVSGLGEVVHFVNVDKYHGFINVTNDKEIEGGKLKIDLGAEIDIASGQKTAVQEGAHNILVTGNNVEDYAADVFIVAGEDFPIDLTAVQKKTGILTIHSNVTGYQLYVNNRAVEDSTAPQVLNLGEYTIRIVKNGYKPWQRDIKINEPSLEIEAALETVEKPKEEPAPVAPVLPVAPAPVEQPAQAPAPPAPEPPAEEEPLLTTPPVAPVEPDPPTSTSFIISSSPEGADIYINDKMVGNSPVQIELPFGDYRLLVKKGGYYEASTPFTVNSNTKTISIALTASE